MSCLIVGIAGGSASGKSTLANMLKEEIGESCSILYQDSYYIDQSSKFDGDGGSVNFDHPSAIDFQLIYEQLCLYKNGKDINVPIYDFATHTRKKVFQKYNHCPILIVDGILILHDHNLRNFFDFKIFVETKEDVRFSRRLKRDTTERGRTADGVHKQFYGQVAPMHNEYVEPSKHFADLIINGESNFIDQLSMIKKQILG